MAGHTPGPWSVDKNFIETNYLICCDISDRNRGYVASLAVTNDDALSNAQLISAAPDMLEALKLAEKYISAAADRGYPVTRGHQVVRAAIAKAEGA